MPDLLPRSAAVRRTTAETDVTLALRLDPQTEDERAYSNATGLGFLDHMLDLFARHGGFGLDVTCEGDLHVDDHHTAEDVGIALGQALHQALGDKAYVARYGHAYVPMDEALARAAVDLSGRFFLHFEADFSRPTVGDLSTEMVEHFFYSMAEGARMNLHVDLIRGRNAHHQVEAIFKAVARALRVAVRRDPAGDRLPSTKEAL
jgi:imidazoleglycerol-phosphate dehydratase